VQSSGVTHRYRQGALYLPDDLAGVVIAVLGIDDRPQARAHFRVAASPPGRGKAPTNGAAPVVQPAPPTPPYTSAQVATAYGFPAGTTGAGQTIALIELGGGYSQSDITSYCGQLGIAVPTITAVSVDGTNNSPGTSDSDVEVALDIEVICGAAPGATQLVYFTPNTDQGFIDAVAQAAHATPAPVAISISWGQSEDVWTAQGRTALDGMIADACALGITVCVAAGDSGSADGTTGGVHVDFPASSPHALACGGTSLIASGSTITSETVWNDGSSGGATGGGVSDAFPVPTWQASAGVPVSAGNGKTGRGVPDVAGNADPDTGYSIIAHGQSQVVGGTSAVAPLWAALVARLAQAAGERFGLIQSALYSGVTAGAAATGFHDITQGSNGAYTAGPGWDACTGLGSPNGSVLVARVAQLARPHRPS
jgi:kumamolisin